MGNPWNIYKRFVDFVNVNVVIPIVTEGPVAAGAPVVNEVPAVGEIHAGGEAPVAEAPGAGAVGGFDNNTYASLKSATQGLLNGSILLGNVFLIISISSMNKNMDGGVDMFVATTTFLGISIAFEFINAILAIFLLTFRRGSNISVWLTFWALILSFLGLIFNAIASYLVSLVTPDLVSKMSNMTTS